MTIHMRNRTAMHPPSLFHCIVSAQKYNLRCQVPSCAGTQIGTTRNLNIQGDSMNRLSLRIAAMLFLVAVFAVGCAQMGGLGKQEYTKKSGVGPGMNAKGEVVDSKLVESGYGKQVKGLGDWEGEITGKSAADSKFTKLKIGMSMRQTTDLIGQPSDQGSYMTGKAWIPYYFGSDRHRYEMVYKGTGRLIFAGGSISDLTGGNLIWIIHNKNEPRYR